MTAVGLFMTALGLGLILLFHHMGGRPGNNQKRLGFRLIKKCIHILQQIILFQKEDKCLHYDYRPSVQF